jgi:hypothetical protein
MDGRMATFGRSFLIAALGAAIFLPTLAWSDVVINTRGRRLEGEITRETSASVTIQLNDGSTVILPWNAVAEIQRNERWDNLVSRGEHALSIGDHERARESFEQALLASPPESEIPAIQAAIADAVEGLADRASAEREAGLAQIETLLETADSHRRAGEWVRAGRALAEAENLRPTDEQRERIHDLRAETLYSQAYSLNDRLDTPGALEVLLQLLAIEPSHPEGLNLYNQIVAAQPLNTPEQVAEIESILENNPSRLDLHARVGEYYSRRNNHAKALPHLLAASESELHLAQIRERLKRAMVANVDDAVQRADYDGAINLYEELLRRFPEEDQNYLNILIYHQQRRELEDDDLEGHLRLAIQCREAGYNEWAREQMQHILAIDPNNAGALQLHRGFAEEAFEESMASLREENFAVARMQLERFIEAYGYEDLAERAQQALADAQLRLREQEQRRRESAEALVLRADDYHAAAQRSLDDWNQLTYRDRSNFTIRGVSRREEVVRNLNRAVDYYTAALQLDPTLGPPDGGDVFNKRSDAQSLLRTLTTSRFPTRERQFSRN